MSAKKHLLALAISAALFGGVPLFLLPAPQVAFAQADPKAADEALPKIAKYKLGDSREPLDAVAKLVVAVQQDAPARAALARKLGALAADASATYEARDFACRQLYIIGTPAEIPVLAAMLGDEKMGHMSRYVLEAMGLPEADAALRAALSKAKGRELIGLIGSLGNRRDAKAVTELGALLADAQAAPAVVGALGKIASGESVALLMTIKSEMPEMSKAVNDAKLTAADLLAREGKKAEALAIYESMTNLTPALKIARLRGVSIVAPEKAIPVLAQMLAGADLQEQLMAAAMLRQMPGDAAGAALAAALGAAPAAAKVHILDALAARGQVSARAAVVELAKSTDEPVQVAALRALGSLGDASAIPLLAENAVKTGAAGDAAKSSLAKMKGADVDAAIAAAAAAGPAPVRAELIKALGARGAASATPKLLEIAKADADETVRSAALTALGALATEKDFPALVQTLVAAKTDGERSTAVNAVAQAANRMTNRDDAIPAVAAALSAGDAKVKAALLSALTRIGGPKALAAVRGQLAAAEEPVKEAAVRAITEWQDSSALEDMLKIAGLSNQKHKILALRGINRVLSQRESDKTPAQKLDIFKQMMAACERPDEKKLVIAGLADMKDAAGFAMLTPLLEDPALKNEAGSGIVKLAKALRVNKPSQAALQKVVDSKADANIIKQAQDTLENKK